MALDHDDRTLLGLALAPLATLPVMALVLAFGSRAAFVPTFMGVALSGHLALFGLPIAYVMELVLVLSLRLVGVSPRRFSDGAVLMLGTCAAALLALAFAGWGERDSLQVVGTAALMGGASATTFVLVRGIGSWRRAAGSRRLVSDGRAGDAAALPPH